MTEFAKTTIDNDSVAAAFRSPPAEATSTKSDGLRLRIYRDQDLAAQSISPVGWAAFWGVFFPSATVVELSGKLNETLHIYPTHVQIEKRKWFSGKGVLARYRISIPVYDEIGDSPVHHLHIQSALAFLYPFVPMHVCVMLDDEVVFGLGRFEI